MRINLPRWLLISLLTLVLLMASFVPAVRGETVQSPAEPPPPSSPSPPAERQEEVRVYESFTRPSRQTSVASRVAGLVDRVMVAEGDLVRVDQPLVQLDSTAERLELELSRLAANDTKELEAAELVARQSEAELKRAEKLLAGNAITESELEQRQLAVKVAHLRVEAARAAHEKAELRYRRDLALLQQRTIVAPADGVVLRVLKQKGEALERLETVVEIVQLDPLEIVLNLPADTRPLYRLGQPATVIVQADNTRRITAKVTAIDPTIDFASGTYRLKVQLPNPKGDIASGVRASIELPAAAAAGDAADSSQ